MPDLDPFFFTINTWSFTKHRVWNRCQRQDDYEVHRAVCEIQSNSKSGKNPVSQELHLKICRPRPAHPRYHRPADTAPLREQADGPSGALAAFARNVSRYKDIGGEIFTEYRNGERSRVPFLLPLKRTGRPACTRSLASGRTIRAGNACGTSSSIISPSGMWG